MTAPPITCPRPFPTTGPLSAQLVEVTGHWGQSQQRIVELAAEFADSAEWVLAGSPSPAHWLAAVAGVEACTAREWVRIGKQLRDLPATADNEAELLALAFDTPAGDLGRVLAAWLTRTSSAEDLERHQRRQRSVRWRTDPDGMVIFTLRLPPFPAAMLIAWLTRWVMTSRRPTSTHRAGASADAPTVAQQHADAMEALVTSTATPSADDAPTTERSGAADGHPSSTDDRREPRHEPRVETELVIHVRGDGYTFDDGTPISDSIVGAIAPTALLRALIHDANGRPINASGRQRHPSTRQKRVVKERDRVCRDCGRADLLEYDHVPAYETTGHTVVDELELRCAPCHDRRHAA